MATTEAAERDGFAEIVDANDIDDETLREAAVENIARRGAEKADARGKMLERIVVAAVVRAVGV